MLVQSCKARASCPSANGDHALTQSLLCSFGNPRWMRFPNKSKRHKVTQSPHPKVVNLQDGGATMTTTSSKVGFSLSPLFAWRLGSNFIFWCVFLGIIQYVDQVVAQHKLRQFFFEFLLLLYIHQSCLQLQPNIRKVTLSSPSLWAWFHPPIPSFTGICKVRKFCYQYEMLKLSI